MDILQKVVFALAFFVVASVAIKSLCNVVIGERDISITQYQPKDEVLTDLEQKLKESDFDQLVDTYQREYKIQKEKYIKNKNEGIVTEDDESFEFSEPLYSIAQEIEKRKFDELKYFRVGFYWITGLLVILIGVYIFKKSNHWFWLVIYSLGLFFQIYAIDYSCNLYTNPQYLLVLVLSLLTLTQLIYVGTKAGIFYKTEAIKLKN